MSIGKLPDHWVYSPSVIEFMTVSAQVCLMLERTTEFDKQNFVRRSLALLSMLYLKTTVLEKPEKIYEDDPQRFVTEVEYNDIKDQVEMLLGAHDSYLETFHADMSLSDTPIAAFVSENLADVYQEIKDCAANYQLGETELMNDALVVCIDAFAEHWGQKLLNALRALHNIRHYFSEEESDASEFQYSSHQYRKSMFDFMRDDDDEQMNSLI